MILSITGTSPGLSSHSHRRYFSSLASDLVVALCYNLWDCIGIFPRGSDFIQLPWSNIPSHSGVMNTRCSLVAQTLKSQALD